MSVGKYLSLDEARKIKRLDRFAKEHPSKANKSLFERLLDVMAKPKKPAEDEKTSTEV